MDAIKFKYKGYTVEIRPIENAKTNYNAMIWISKKNVLDWGTSLRNNEPLDKIIELIERVIKQ